MYVTVSELRSEYSNEFRDEFSGRTDDELSASIVRASSTIDRYKPKVSLTTDALEMIKSVCFPISRAYAHDELPLEDEHPIIREYKEAMKWLLKLSEGKVSLPMESNTSSSSPVVKAAARIFV